MRKRKTKRRRRGGASQPRRNINIEGTNLAPTEFFHNPIPLVAEIHQFNQWDLVRVISGPYENSTGTIFEVLNDGTYEVYLEPQGERRDFGWHPTRATTLGQAVEEEEEKEKQEGKLEEEPKRKEKDIEEKKNEYSLTYSFYYKA